MSYWYVATPYTNYAPQFERRDAHEQAYRRACEVTAFLARAGLPVLSPIINGHGLSVWGEISFVEHELWMAIDAPLMAAAKGLIIVKLTGWETSRGIKAEIAAFEEARKPVLYAEPFTIPAGL